MFEAPGYTGARQKKAAEGVKHSVEKVYILSKILFWLARGYSFDYRNFSFSLKGSFCQFPPERSRAWG